MKQIKINIHKLNLILKRLAINMFGVIYAF